MKLDNYTEKAREAINVAHDLAREYHQSQVEPEHLLLALVQQNDGVVPQIMQKLGLPDQPGGAGCPGGSAKAAQSVRHQR